jgi:signal peptidase I
MSHSSREKLQQVISSLLLEGIEVEVPVYGISMFPFLKPGCLVRVRRCGWEELKKGDIIFFESPPKIILHRIIQKSSHQLRCKGDGLLRPDSWIEPSQFLGRVEAYSRGTGFLRTFIARGVNPGLRIEFLSVNRISFRLYAVLMVGFWHLTGFILFPLAILWQKFKHLS